ncbi:hypothetical protein F442_05731 [Phytophthora nicotianae P10297]|uniref:KN homeodomain domain-containing protein n=4 Tax=Phytophthora nicotianae TaxID=4792 RepID=W2ZML4_PHYNI|nr:hypothetical protein L915_05547 [Phytophthora nicotianae]ETL44144.1 hypothetical protein L916_05487 [Phytophthora nicotianae]ETP48543.1 hypothetical protein F442_05731 [Phytophthora nicotianae P10297]
MAFPNRSNYDPFVVTCVDKMLEALSSEGPVDLQSSPTKDECKTLVKINRKRLLEEPVFQGDECNQRLFDAPTMQDQSDTADRNIQERVADQLSSLTLSLSQVSPYAMELAARNNMPKKRSSLSKLSKKLMHDWFEHNLHHPYPTEEEKKALALEKASRWSR